MSYPLVYGVQLRDFRELLNKHEVDFYDEGTWIISGNVSYDGTWLLFVAPKANETYKLLKALLSTLIDNEIPFVLIKDEVLNYRLNAGKIDGHEVGKALTLFAKNEEELLSLVALVEPITNNLSGPAMFDYERVGSILYVTKASLMVDNADEYVIETTKLNGIFPGGLDRWSCDRFDEEVFFKGRYENIKVVVSEPRGTISIGEQNAGEKQRKVLIKRGNPFAVVDILNRSIRDRLRWQKIVVERLCGTIPTAAIIDYEEVGDYTVLIMEYLPGSIFRDYVLNVHRGESWVDLTNAEKCRILRAFLQICGIVREIHSAGFVFRDLSDRNFIVSDEEVLSIIDFELSFDVTNNFPYPPFTLGTFGYVSPEQLKYRLPTFAEDLYSLGALLSFCITGISPHEFIERDINIVFDKLVRVSGDEDLSKVCVWCLDADPEERPSLDLIEDLIRKCIKTDRYELS